MSNHDDDDWTNFGDGDNDGGDDTPKMVVGERSLNSVESELKERLHIEQMLAVSVDIPFVENEDDDAELLRAAAINEIGAIERAPAAEKWLPRIEIARSLGATGTEADYAKACQEQGIEPWPK